MTNQKRDLYFLQLRDKWALRAPEVSAEDIALQQKRDSNLNPHNDSYKPPLRSRAHIVCDVSYSWADQILIRVYGTEYNEFLRDTTPSRVSKLLNFMGQP